MKKTIVIVCLLFGTLTASEYDEGSSRSYLDEQIYRHDLTDVSYADMQHSFISSICVGSYDSATAAVSPNRSLIATQATRSSLIKILDITHQEPLYTIADTNKHIGEIRWVNNTIIAVYYPDDAEIKLYTITDSTCLFTISHIDNQYAWNMSWSPRGRYLAVPCRVIGEQDTHTILYDVTLGKELCSYDRIYTITWSADEQYFAYFRDDAVVCIYDIQSVTEKIINTRRPINRLCMSPNSAYCTTTHFNRDNDRYTDGIIVIWNVHTGELIKQIPLNTGEYVSCLQWSHSSQQLAVCIYDMSFVDKVMVIYNIHGEPQWECIESSKVRDVGTLSWSPDDRFLKLHFEEAAGSPERETFIWHLADDQSKVFKISSDNRSLWISPTALVSFQRTSESLSLVSFDPTGQHMLTYLIAQSIHDLDVLSYDQSSKYIIIRYKFGNTWKIGYFLNPLYIIQWVDRQGEILRKSFVLLTQALNNYYLKATTIFLNPGWVEATRDAIEDRDIKNYWEILYSYLVD